MTLGSCHWGSIQHPKACFGANSTSNIIFFLGFGMKIRYPSWLVIVFFHKFNAQFWAIPPLFLLEHVKPWIDGFGVPPKPDLLLGEELQVRTRKKKKKADNADCFDRATCIHLFHSNHWNDGKGNHPKMA